MTDNTFNLSQTWKTPNELLKIQRLRLRKKALSSRFDKKISEPTNQKEEDNLLEVVVAQKRKNPFAKNVKDECKKQKTSNDESLRPEDNQNQEPTGLILKPFDANSFANIFDEPEDSDDEQQKTGERLPIDWSLKTRMRILCETPLPPPKALKTNQEASGITGFVRCIDSKSTSTNLDLSLGTRFHQAIHYWQHPHLPWMTLFPRNSKDNIGILIGERERESLSKDWLDSFRGLFQLVRARQCPYFYLCANTFTVLFRAAGVGGRVEPHALMTPTSRGMRAAFQKEEIEYTLPLKSQSLNKSNERKFKSEYTILDGTSKDSGVEPNEDEDDLEDEAWLESLGIDENEIKKISSTESRKRINEEIDNDLNDESIILIEGVECQAFFNFLLNAKSTITGVGRLAGVPPTLFAPVAFPKATMQTLNARSSKVRNDGTDYFSIELKGVILPHLLPHVSSLLCESKDAFSITLAAQRSTLALSRATKKLIEDVEKENQKSDQIFGIENLSDCGLSTDVIKGMCLVAKDAVSVIDRMCFNKEVGFVWS